MDFKTRLERYYQIRCPSKLKDVSKIAVKYKDKEKELFRQLTFKYGPEEKLSNADKTAIKARQPPKLSNNLCLTKEIDIEEYFDSLLNDDDRKILSQIEKNGITQEVLDKI